MTPGFNELGARVGHLFVIVAAVAIAGCSSSKGGSTGTAGSSGGSSAGTGGPGGGSGAAGVSGGAGASGSGGTAGHGGSGGGGGNPVAGATPLTVGATATSGTLADATSAHSGYSFSGTQGELVQITTTTGGATPFDPTALDLVITLYDPSGTQLAQAGDPWPRVTDAPTLYTALPATGTYAISVDNCLTVFGSGCRPSAPIVNRGYTIRVADLSAPTLIHEGAEPGNDAVAGAAAIPYTKAGGTSYQPLLLYGLFQSMSDQDTYTFTVPADAPVAAGARARANFWIQPTGTRGDGSTAAPGKAYVVDPADTSGAHVVDLDDFQFGTGVPASDQPANLSFPVTLGKSYTFVITNTTALPPGTNGFYFVQHLGGAGADAPTLEHENNDTQATADSLAAIDNLDGSYTFTVDGDLNPPATDVDFHHLQLPSGLTMIDGSCVARRQGSGLESLLYKLVKSDGTVQFQQTEIGNTDDTIGNMQIPTGGLTIAVSAGAQLSGITNASYVCRFIAKP